MTDRPGKDTAARTNAKKTHKESEERYALVLAAVNDGLWDWDVRSGNAYFSPLYYNILGYGDREFHATFESWRLLVHPDDIDRAIRELQQGVESGRGFAIDLRMKKKSGEWLWVSTRGKAATLDTNGRALRMVGTLTDITERKQAETYADMGREILQILNEPGAMRGSLQRVITTLRQRTGFDAAGIRLKDGDDFPYYVQEGLSRDFLSTENTLVERRTDGDVCRNSDGSISLECTCGLVLSGRADPASPLFTKGGSFWTNDSLPLLDLAPGQDPRHNIRNRCIHDGYASIALIPIRARGEIVGLIHLNDRRKGRLTLRSVELLEEIATRIGEALVRRQTEEELTANYAAMVEAQAIARIGDWSMDTVTRTFVWSDEVYAIHELKKQNGPLRMSTYAELIRPDDRHRVFQVMQSALAKQLQGFGVDYHIILPDGTERFISLKVNTLADSSGTVTEVHGTMQDITDRKKAEDALENERMLLRTLIDNIPDSVYLKDLACRKTLANPAEVHNMGVATEAEALGKDDFSIYPRELAEKFFADDQSVIHTGRPILDREEYVIDGRGKKRWLISSKLPLRNRDGQITGLLGIGHDVTERKEMDDKLRIAQLQWNQFLEASPDAMWIKDAAGRYVATNKTFRMVDPDINGGDIIGRTDAECYSREKATVYAADDRIAIEKGMSEGEFTAVGADGKLRSFLTKKVALRNQDGSAAGTLGVSRDITERKEMERKVEEMATHDFLTGLPNRRLLFDRFAIAMALARRNKARIAIMSFDLDKFKTINDTFGHDAGDQVLKAVGMRLTGTLRASDTLARIGGDEFVAMMVETGPVESISAMAGKLLNSFAEPFSISGHQIRLSVSIGVAVYPEDAENLDMLTRQSDAALYYSKNHGGNQFRLYRDRDVHIG